MIKRVVDISNPGYIHLKHSQLIIKRDREVIASISIEDLGVLILQHPGIVITQAVIIACQKNNVVVVLCDAQHLPYSALLPLTEANSLHSRVIQQQIAASTPVKKRLWQTVVRYKLNEQAETLQQLGKDSTFLQALAQRVKSGDTGNLEAQGAQRYWPALMGKDFRRNQDMAGANSLLNYGYAIIRATMARAICGTGLHPTLGIHHSNQYNGLCLADDLMEPLRPWVDYLVCRLPANKQEVSQESKRIMLSLLAAKVRYQKKKMPLMLACSYLCSDFKKSLGDKTLRLNYPQWTRAEIV